MIIVYTMISNMKWACILDDINVAEMARVFCNIVGANSFAQLFVRMNSNLQNLYGTAMGLRKT